MPVRDLAHGRDRKPLDPPTCWRCWQEQRDREELEAETREVMADLDGWVTGQLKRLGLASREAKAVMTKVNPQILDKLPKGPAKAVVAGEVPVAGFGLGGNTDGGKSMAVAAILREGLTAWAKRELPKNPKTKPGWFLWASWPDEVTWLRNHAIDPAAALRIEDLAQVPLLILDDLGRERIKGSYADDWAASQLDSIVNARYREELVTIWTTNVKEAVLAKDLYGGALMRRLTAENPLTWIEDLRSAR